MAVEDSDTENVPVADLDTENMTVEDLGTENMAVDGFDIESMVVVDFGTENMAVDGLDTECLDVANIPVDYAPVADSLVDYFSAEDIPAVLPVIPTIPPLDYEGLHLHLLLLPFQ